MSEAKQVDFLLVGLVSPETGEPLSGGAVYVYEAGTSTSSNLWLDRAKTDIATNPIILDASGKALVFGDGVYRFVVREVADSTEPIIIEYDGLEYTPNLVSDSQTPLIEDLDFAGFKGINAGPGSDPTDTINKDQLDTVETALQGEIVAVQNNLDNTEFLDLTDTPNVYTAANKKLVRVKDDLSGVEFISVDDAMVDANFTSLFDTPASYATHMGKAAIVNSTSDGLTFGYPDSKTLQGKAISTDEPDNEAVLKYNSTTETWEPEVSSVESLGITRELLWSGSASNTDVTVSAPNVLLMTIQNTVYNTATITFDPVAVAEGSGEVLHHWASPNADRSYDAIITVSKSGDNFTLNGPNLQRITAILMSGG